MALRPRIAGLVRARSIAMLVLVFGAGCSSEIPKYAVRGQVVYEDGEPVPGGVTIVFESAMRPHRRASGDVDSEGRFSLSTRQTGDGAMAGKHRVRFTAAATPAQPDPTVIVARHMDRKYCDFASSGITVDIAPRDDNDFTIRVERGTGTAAAGPGSSAPAPTTRSPDPAEIVSPDVDAS